MYVEKCNKTVVTFVVMTEPPVVLDDSGTPLPPGKREINRFDFDFRYYSPYTGSEFKKPGVYVFKTSDKDS
jgi:hypothetical protein